MIHPSESGKNANLSKIDEVSHKITCTLWSKREEAS